MAFIRIAFDIDVRHLWLFQYESVEVKVNEMNENKFILFRNINYSRR